MKREQAGLVFLAARDSKPNANLIGLPINLLQIKKPACTVSLVDAY